MTHVTPKPWIKGTHPFNIQLCKHSGLYTTVLWVTTTLDSCDILQLQLPTPAVLAARLWPMPWTPARSALFGRMALQTWYSARPWRPLKDVQVGTDGGWNFWPIFSPKKKQTPRKINIDLQLLHLRIRGSPCGKKEKSSELNHPSIFQVQAVNLRGCIFHIWNWWMLMNVFLVFDRIWQQIRELEVLLDLFVLFVSCSSITVLISGLCGDKSPSQRRENYTTS